MTQGLRLKPPGRENFIPQSSAHAVESLTLYGIRQAGDAAGKHDRQRAVVIAAAERPDLCPHTDERATQVGWDERIFKFADSVFAEAAGLSDKRPAIV